LIVAINFIPWFQPSQFPKLPDVHSLSFLEEKTNTHPGPGQYKYFQFDEALSIVPNMSHHLTHFIGST